jgi:hypothetical protein
VRPLRRMSASRRRERSACRFGWTTDGREGRLAGSHRALY